MPKTAVTDETTPTPDSPVEGEATAIDTPPAEPTPEPIPKLPPISGAVPGRVAYYTPKEVGDLFVAIPGKNGEEGTPGFIVAFILSITPVGGGCANLQLFPDAGENPKGYDPYVSGVFYDADGKPGTYRFTR